MKNAFTFSVEIDLGKGQFISERLFGVIVSTKKILSAPIICHFDSSSRLATRHHDELDLFKFLFSIRMLLDK